MDVVRGSTAAWRIRIEAAEPTPEAVVDAIRAGRVEPRVRETPVDAAMRTGYEFVHRFR